MAGQPTLLRFIMVKVDHIVLRPEQLKSNVFDIFDTFIEREPTEVKEIFYCISQRIQQQPNLRLDLLISDVIEAYDKEKSAINTQKDDPFSYLSLARRIKND